MGLTLLYNKTQQKYRIKYQQPLCLTSLNYFTQQSKRMSTNQKYFLQSQNNENTESKLINSQLANNSYPQQTLENQSSNTKNNQTSKYVNFMKSKHNQVKKSNIQLQLEQLQRKLYHQIILKGQFQGQNDFQKLIVYKLSQQVKQNLSQKINQITSIEQKLQNPLLNHTQKQQIKQKMLEIRMQQLADTRVLVNTYRHHQYRLVLASFHISMIYQQLKCYEQSINHLQIALQINNRYKQTNKDALYFQSFLLTYLAQAQFDLQIYQSSLASLNQSIQIHYKLLEEDYKVHDFATLSLMARVLTLSQKQQDSISYAKMALQSAQKMYGKQSLQYANGFRILAEVQANAQKWEQSVQNLNTAIQILQASFAEKQQTIIDFYGKLAEITLKKLNNQQDKKSPSHYDPYIEVLKKKHEVIQNTYGYRDKRSIKQKRHLASSLLKYYKTTQAQQELQDILEIQEVVYGQKSVEVGKTLKLLGSIAMSLNQTKKAQKYLKKSLNIFHDQGFTHLQKQVQAKLLVLTGKGKFLVHN